ncbi:hypothetical protein J3R83DRAFT_2894 [Lanmaoa asiatica]|nr:hypothetical protein J3R83DRAFT_2894 [Lanmaoa asiatica]
MSIMTEPGLTRSWLLQIQKFKDSVHNYGPFLHSDPQLIRPSLVFAMDMLFYQHTHMIAHSLSSECTHDLYKVFPCKDKAMTKANVISEAIIAVVKLGVWTGVDEELVAQLKPSHRVVIWNLLDEVTFYSKKKPNGASLALLCFLVDVSNVLCLQRSGYGSIPRTEHSTGSSKWPQHILKHLVLAGYQAVTMLVEEVQAQEEGFNPDVLGGCCGCCGRGCGRRGLGCAVNWGLQLDFASIGGQSIDAMHIFAQHEYSVSHVSIRIGSGIHRQPQCQPLIIPNGGEDAEFFRVLVHGCAGLSCR